MNDYREHLYNWSSNRHTTNPDHAKYMDHRNHKDELHVFLNGLECLTKGIVRCKTGKDGCIENIVFGPDGAIEHNATHDGPLIEKTYGHVEVKSNVDIQIGELFDANNERLLAFVEEYEQAKSTEDFGDWLIRKGYLTIEDDGLTSDEHGNLVAVTRIALN